MYALQTDNHARAALCASPPFEVLSRCLQVLDLEGFYQPPAGWKAAGFAGGGLDYWLAAHRDPRYRIVWQEPAAQHANSRELFSLPSGEKPRRHAVWS